MRPNFGAHGADVVVVPAAVVDGLDGSFGGRDEDLVAAGFVVEAAPVVLADIGLVAGHFVGWGGLGS